MFKVVFISSILAALCSLNPGSPEECQPAKSASNPDVISESENGPGLVERSAENDNSENGGAKRASAKSLPYAQVAKISSQIDELVDAKLAENSERRNPLTNDETFLRRIYLDVVGRIPTLDETNRFLDSKKSNKRALLIDELLDSYGHVSHQFNFWADLLRIKSRHQNVTGQPYIDYMKNSIESNKPYDQLVRELITSEGPLLKPDNGAVGYYIRDRNMPEDNMSNTIRVFLGTRLECAQCHDHPFDDWTQRQYYEMVAFTGGLMSQLPKPDSKYADELAGLRRNSMSDELNEEQRRKLRGFLEPLRYGVAGTGTGLTRLPENYMSEDDGEEFEIVKARTMFEGKELVKPTVPVARPGRGGKRKPQSARQRSKIKGAKEIDSRESYAQWLTEPENPRFTVVMANRLWKQAMGLGLIEPVDDMTKNTKASNPELMEFLATTFVDLDYDMKQFQRAVFNSKTYQARAMGEDVIEPSKFYFNGPVVRRMTAEQAWDSLLVLTIPEVDQRQSLESLRYMKKEEGKDIYQQYAEIRSLSLEEIMTIVKDPSRRAGKGQGNMMMESGMKPERNGRNELKRLTKEIARAQKEGDRKKLATLNRQMNRLTLELRDSPKLAAQMNRASEIRSPAPTGHFLREFGQSDRETIQNADTNPAVTQALSLMNGLLESRIAKNSSTVLMQNLAKAKDSKEAVEIVFLTMLNRKPKSNESAIWERDFRAMPMKVVLSDLIWTLANSNEFIFVK